ncbi:IS3 family transposase, partial [Shigella flexneri]|nr:IS3 family transposase [Shigella flexneri]
IDIIKHCCPHYFPADKVFSVETFHFISREIMRATVFNYIECDYNRYN